MELLTAKSPGPVVVTGMHRSGTSAIIQLLGANGFDLGDPATRLPRTNFNVHGTFERGEIVGFNERLLAAASSSWQSPPTLDQLGSVPGEMLNEGKVLLDRLKSECEADRVLVVGDPRVSALMPLWRRIAGPDAIFVFCMRNPVSVALSLLRRDGIPLPEGIALSTIYCELFLAGLDDAHHLIIDTDRGRKDSRYRESVLTSLAEACGVSGTSFTDTFDSRDFHEGPSREEFERLVPVGAARTYACFIRASDNPRVDGGGGLLAASARDSSQPASLDFLDALSGQGSAHRESLSKLTDASPSQTSAMHKQARELRAAHERVQELTEQLHAAQKTLDGVLSSRSWRITRPLRRALGSVGRRTMMSTTTVREAPRLAVTLHVFYPEFLSRFEDRLSALDADVDVFVTTPAGLDRSWHDRWARLPRVNDLVVRDVPNRGRNFGPLLVEFGERLLDYDYIIHAHSKKSLRTGREQVGWAEECLEAALPASGRLAARIQTLEDDRTIGGFRPGVSQHLPYWAFHWLQNSHWGRVAGVSEIAPQDSFLEYPVGGMFLARSDSIRPLLSKRWSYADFPAESGQADGTLHHAVERLIGHLVTHTGQRFVVPPAQDQRLVREFVLEANRAELERVADRGFLEDASLTVSFDLFDTLVERRGLMTEQAKWAGGRQAAALGLAGVDKYVGLRNGVELELRSRLPPNTDVSLDDVTLGCARALGLDGPEASKLAQALARAEIDFDSAILVPRAGLFSTFVRRLESGLPTLVISDSFYSSEDLTGILRSLGAPVAPHVVFSSASTGSRKDRGDVWDLVGQDRSLAAGSFLHVGDNVVSDIQMPSDRSIPTLHVLSARDRWHLATGRLLPQPTNHRRPRESDDLLERALASEVSRMELTRVLERPRRNTFAGR